MVKTQKNFLPPPPPFIKSRTGGAGGPFFFSFLRGGLCGGPPIIFLGSLIFPSHLGKTIFKKLFGFQGQKEKKLLIFFPPQNPLLQNGFHFFFRGKTYFKNLLECVCKKPFFLTPGVSLSRGNF